MRAPPLAALALLIAATATPALPQEGWRTFEGSWSASGRRETLPTDGTRPASVLRISGAVVLTTGDGLARGFHGDAIGFDDGDSAPVGRAVWTDDRGDRIFSTLVGEPLETGGRVTGRITGGTGRYAGLAGEYVLTWQYVVRTEDGTVQGRTVDLRGRFLRREMPP